MSNSDLPPLSRFLADSLPVPTHFYTVVTSCQELNQTVEECDGPLRVFSFLLPHRPDNSEACNVSSNNSQQGAAQSQLSLQMMSSVQKSVIKQAEERQ